ncbi:cytochrome P450 4c21-like [Uranotaenia lowii]|uniref:cytochrome P450 4c21-like n=1 Tax=Uranotaenia lowii TaxID=190385 RepID=UPI0024791EBF|nr:cytochrome P450 4c21-like [Uranotaenia lowii]
MWLFLVTLILVSGAFLLRFQFRAFFAIIGLNESERFRLISGSIRNCERSFRIRFGPVRIIGSCHPDVIQQVLTHPDCLERPFFFRFTGLERGLLSAEHRLWKHQRKILNPTFNVKILNSFIPIFEDYTGKMVQSLIPFADGKSQINIFKYTSKSSMETIFGTTIGTDISEQSADFDLFFGYRRLLHLISKRMVNMHLYLDWIYRWTRDYREERYLRKMCFDRADMFINKQREALSGQNPTEDPESESYKKPQIFIRQLLDQSLGNYRFSDEEIYHNAYTIIVTGNDTTALTVANGCLLLGLYPSVQDKVYEEILRIYPNRDVPITPDSLKQLNYTEMFIKETLRLLPTVPNVAREATQDIQIDGQSVPKGTIFLLSLYELHHRLDIWGNRFRDFDPENFLPDRAKDRHPFGYLPFGGGSRNCIGWRYALLAIKVMFVGLLRQFRIEFEMTLKLEGEHLIRLEKRSDIEEDGHRTAYLERH